MYTFKNFESTDYNGEKYTDDYQFFLNKAELVKLENSVDGGYAEMMKRIIAAQDQKTLINEFEKLVLLAYGKVSPDGRHFYKSDDMRREFEQSAAYPDIYMLLAVNSKVATEFCNKIIPENLEAQIKAAMEFE